MNLANKLTIARIFLSFLFLVFLILNDIFFHYIALLVFILACLTDFFDGYVARKLGQVTNFGRFMDPMADKVLITMGLISFAGLHIIKYWVVVMIVVREILITGIRAFAAFRGVIIHSIWIAKLKTFSQMILIIISLLYTIARFSLGGFENPFNININEVTVNFIHYFSIFVLILTLVSGIYYLWKNREILISAVI